MKGVRDRIAAGVDVNAAGKDEAPALFAAVGSGKLEVVQALLSACADVNRIAYPSKGASVKSTPLCYAINCGFWEIAQELVRVGADVALEPWKGENAAGGAAERASKAYYTFTASEDDWFGKKRTKSFMEEARVACERWIQFVREAIARGVKVRDYWLWNAVNTRHTELALLLISSGVNPNAAPHGSSVLVRSIEHGSDEITLALIKAGADVKTPTEAAPLLMAAKMGRITVVPALLDAGADINVAGDVVIGEFGEPEIEEENDAKGAVISRTTHFADPPVAEGSTALIIATRLGNHDLVKLLLERGADLNQGDKHGLPALGWALRLGKQDIAESLKKAGAKEPEFLEGSLNTSLWSAARDGDAVKVEMLLGRGAKADDLVEDREGKHYPLVSAAREGRLAVVELLVRHGANVNIGANENWTTGITPLMAAAREGRIEVVKALLGAKADVEVKDAGFEGGGETSLHYAARGGHAQVIQALLDAGAKMNAKAKGGSTPLLIAVSETKLAAAKALIANGADTNAGPADGSGPLYLAALQHQLEMVKLLLAHGAQPLPPGKKRSFLPLAAAASKGALEIVQLLLKAGAPVNEQSALGDTALNSAALRGHDDVVKILLDAGANPNISERDGFTSLMAGIRSGKEIVVQLLLQAGADVNAVDSDGRTVLKIAREGKNKKIIALIEDAAEKAPPEKPAGRKQEQTRTSKKKTSPAPDETEEEEDFEPPDFSKSAASAEFKSILREVEKLCATKPEPLGDLEGSFSFAVTRADAEKLLADHHQRLLQKGAYLFRHHRDYHDLQDKLGLLPTREWSDLIRAFQTNGANFDLMPADIIAWMQKLSARQPFIITGVSWDWLEGRFTSPVKDSRKLAHQMYEFCPDIVDQGIGSVKNLAQALEKDGYFFFWWD